MKKTKNALLIFLFALVFENKAQSNFIIAGQHDTSDYYYDIVPDSVLHTYSGPASIYDFDLNNDGTNDYGIMAYCACSIGSPSSFSAITISSNRNNNKIAFYNLGSCNDSMSRPYNIYDSIQSKNTTWGNKLFFVVSYTNIINGIGNCSDSIKNSCYIGLKLMGPTDTLFGWLNIQVNFGLISLKEFACNKSHNVGIKKIDLLNQISVYPNPAKDILNVELGMLNEKTEIKLFDVLGNKVLSTTQKQIDVSNLQSGVYFVQVKTNEGILSKKIIVQQ